MPFPTSKSLIKRLRRPVTAITAYDYPAARICDETGVGLILVGDSLGMVVAGNEDTTSVTLDHMVYHTEMVRRGVRRAVLVSDLPYATYETPEMALNSSLRLMDAGADAVKLEGGFGQILKLERLREAGIAVCAHIGMLPQRVKKEGGYKKKGKSEEEASNLIRAAIALEQAGAIAIVLESVVAEVAAKITDSVEIPTIGIGSGCECGGQIRVIHDVIGGYPWFVPPFATVHGDVARVMRQSVGKFIKEIELTDKDQ